MPKIGASLADISTEYVLIEPDTYEMKLEKLDITEKDELKEDPEKKKQQEYLFISKVDQPGNDHHGKPVRDYVYLYKKDGTFNEYSLAQIKRYGIAIVGEDRVNEDDFDTDELLHGRFLAEVYIDSWKNEKTGKEGQSNKLKNISPL